MIKYIQNKKIDYSLFSKFLEKSQKTNQYTNRGPAKFALEKKLESVLEIQEDKCVICVANGTLALHALLFFYEKRGLKKTISPSYTFPSCNVGGIKPSLVDIDKATGTMPIDDLELFEKNDIILLTNLFGTHPESLNEIIDISKNMNKIVILDNASSPCSKIEGINYCNLGDAAFGSLHHTKYLGFGEGGFIVADKKNKEEMNQILGFGFNGLSKERVSTTCSSNFKMSDVSAAAILQHIERYDLEAHRKVQEKFISFVSSLSGISVYKNSDGVIYGNLPLLYESAMEVDYFLYNGIEAKKYYYPLSKHENSLELYSRIINLPLHADLSDYEIESICESIAGSVK